MNNIRSVIVTFCVLSAASCSTGSKFVDPRSDLDRKIYYVERDDSGDANDMHPISSSSKNYSDTNQVVERIPLPAVVDINSTIQIKIAKSLDTEQAAGALSTGSDALVKKKQILTETLASLDAITRARITTLKAYEKGGKDNIEFFQARQKSEQMEYNMLETLTKLWKSTDPATYREFSKSYTGRPDSKEFSAFLRRQIAALDAPHRSIERELKLRERTLSMEAFLISPGKDPAAIHLDGYDSIKAESLRRSDPLGLDLSPQELERLQKQVKSSQELAAMLEQVRSGQLALNDAVEKLAEQTTPEFKAMTDQAKKLAKRFDSSALQTRKTQTQKLLDEYLSGLKQVATQSQDKIVESKNRKLTEVLDNNVFKQASDFRAQLRGFLDIVQGGGADAQKATPESVIALIQKAPALAKSFENLVKILPNLTTDVEQQVSSFLDESQQVLNTAANDTLLHQKANELKQNLQQYVADTRDISAFIATVTALRTQPVPVLPATNAASLQVPLNNIKDTFIDLEQTPRQIGDYITVKATLKEKDSEQVLDSSIARFQVGHYGHYAELSPAVVLVKPETIAGTDTGYRFAPTLSWMHHWAPRPEDQGTVADFFRSMDPSIGIHSAFLNFNSPTSTNSAQIGLGITLAFWKNRLQFGYGYNLMAKSRDEGRTYFFIGSDLIGLLQTVGLIKK